MAYGKLLLHHIPTNRFPDGHLSNLAAKHSNGMIRATKLIFSFRIKPKAVSLNGRLTTFIPIESKITLYLRW